MKKSKVLSRLLVIMILITMGGCFSPVEIESSVDDSSSLESSSSSTETFAKIDFVDYGTTLSQTIKVGGAITPPAPKGVSNFSFVGWWDGEKYADFSTEACQKNTTYRAEYGANENIQIFTKNPNVEGYGAYELLNQFAGEQNVYQLTMSAQNTDMYR